MDVSFATDRGKSTTHNARCVRYKDQVLASCLRVDVRLVDVVCEDAADRDQFTRVCAGHREEDQEEAGEGSAGT